MKHQHLRAESNLGKQLRALFNKPSPASSSRRRRRIPVAMGCWGDGRVRGAGQRGSPSRGEQGRFCWGFSPVWDRGAGKARRGREARQSKRSCNCRHRHRQRDAGRAEKSCSAPFFGYESADPTLHLSALLSPRCAILSVSDQD